MTARTTMRLAALATLGIAGAIILVRDIPGQDDIPPGPVETISGVPFPITREGIHVTEPLAHVRIPFSRTSVGKTLDLDLTVSAIYADMVEIGVRRGSFWLDYERTPVRHRVLDRLALENSGWTVRQNGTETVFFPPDAPVAASSVEAFLASPPSSGTIGLYGNTTLPCAAENTCTAAPFRITDDPNEFSAMYARYTPEREDKTTKHVSVPLTTLFQNPDGSFDVMFFLQNRSPGEPSMTLENIHASVRPTWVSIGEVHARTRRLLRDFRAYLQGAERP